MNIQLKGIILIAVLFGGIGVIPIVTMHPVFGAGTNSTNSTSNTNSTNSTRNTNSTNSTAATTVTTTPTANASSSSYPLPPYTSPTGTPSSGSSPITVATDKSSYNAGDKITISGTSSAYLSDTPVTIMVRNPVGNIIKVDQVALGTDQTYSATLTADGALWQAAGTYSVYVQLGSQDRSATTTFTFTGVTHPSSNTIPVDGTNFSISYTIVNGTVLDIKTDQQHTSLLVSIKTTGDGVLTITLPRALIDSKNADGTDKAFVVSNDGQIAQFTETTTSTDRTLTIPFKDGTQQIAIMGTFVIPEFGPITALVLIIAIVSIIAISSRTGLRFTPKY